MKKLLIATAIVFGLSMTTFAQSSMFHYENSGNNGNAIYQERSFFTKEGGEATPSNPGHGQGGNQDAPLGSGIAMLTALGAAYAVAKKRREE